MNKQQKQEGKFNKFHDVDRDKIDWYPTINENKCIGCGMCVTTYSRDVYKFDYKNKKLNFASKIGWQVFAEGEPAIFLNWRCLFEKIRTGFINGLGGQNYPELSFCPPRPEAETKEG